MTNSSSATLSFADLQLPHGTVRYAQTPSATRTLLVLHGLGANLAHWLPFAEWMSQNASYQVILFDLPAFGQSSPASNAPSLRKMIEVSLDVIAATVGRRVSLLGHCLGANVALGIATDRPEFVDRLAICTPFALEPTRTKTERLSQWPIVGVFARRLLERTIRHKLMSRSHRYAFHCESMGETIAWVLAAREQLASFEAMLRRIRCPSLVLGGLYDPVVAPALMTRIAREMNSDRTELFDCAHQPHLEMSERFNRLMYDFFEPATHSDSRIVDSSRAPLSTSVARDLGRHRKKR